MNKETIIAMSLLIFQNVIAQPAPIPYHMIDLDIVSPVFDGEDTDTVDHTMVYSVNIGEEDAPYLRLFFGATNLGHNSYVKITSLLDGAAQDLNSQSLARSNNATGFFNGYTMLVELYVYKYDTGIFFELDSLFVGEMANDDEAFSRSICGEDDRVSSNHGAVGRMVPVGCSVWIASNGLLVSAGHCYASNQTIEFNVPPSLNNGTIQHPGFEDQYAIGDYVVYQDDGPFYYGNDWLVFNVENNAITNLQPIEAQGASFALERPSSLTTSDEIRITGFGVDGPPPSYGAGGSLQNEDNQTQQTNVGNFHSSDGTILRYVVDTQPGNSGSPVIRESNGKSIGIHTTGGCTSSGGSNKGTSLLHDSLWSALYGSADSLDPNPVTELEMDMSNGFEVVLGWTDPTTLFGGDPISDFVIDIRRNGLAHASISSGLGSFTDYDLICGQSYQYHFVTRLLANDSTSTAADITTSTTGGEFVLGDITNDQTINMFDVYNLLILILGNDTYDGTEFCAADVDFDNELTIADVLRLVDIVFGRP